MKSPLLCNNFSRCALEQHVETNDKNRVETLYKTASRLFTKPRRNALQNCVETPLQHRIDKASKLRCARVGKDLG